MIPLRVNDLKQWNYCKRIVFYNTLMPVAAPPTFKMEYGKKQEDLFAKLETRRVLRRYGLEDGERLFRLSLFSPGLGLSGKLDLLIRTQQKAYPVDFKYSQQAAFANHLYQLAGYSLLVEDQLGMQVPAAFVYMIPKKRLFRFEVTEELKAETKQQLQTIREMLNTQSFPEATVHRNRCYNCEYLNFCGDVL